MSIRFLQQRYFDKLSTFPAKEQWHKPACPAGREYKRQKNPIRQLADGISILLEQCITSSPSLFHLPFSYPYHHLLLHNRFLVVQDANQQAIMYKIR
jgi:hypothetical protein